MADVPEEFVTVTSTVPDPAGEVAVIEVPSELTETLEAVALPKLTVDPCVNPVPLIVTMVPPVAGPEFGDSSATTGM